MSEDRFQGERFDYMVTNPPFGVSWNSEKDFVQNESENSQGRFSVGTPRVSDGSLLFLQHMISKMEDKGSRIGIVFNGSPLFTGDSGSGESEIRKWIIENDWLECIVSLPDQLFFNTGISTYVWIVSNKKSGKRQGKVQMIDGSSFFKSMKKSLGNKRKEISDEGRDKLLGIFKNFEEDEFCKIKLFSYIRRGFCSIYSRMSCMYCTSSSNFRCSWGIVIVSNAGIRVEIHFSRSPDIFYLLDYKRTANP